jgi:hypothetical protein
MGRFLTQNEIPLCKKSAGCKIQDIAQDREINRIVRVYMRARNLLEYPHLMEVGHEILKAEGLRDASLLMMLENVVQEYRKQRREEERQKEDAQKLTRGKIGTL